VQWFTFHHGTILQYQGNKEIWTLSELIVSLILTLVYSQIKHQSLNTWYDFKRSKISSLHCLHTSSGTCTYLTLNGLRPVRLIHTSLKILHTSSEWEIMMMAFHVMSAYYMHKKSTHKTPKKFQNLNANQELRLVQYDAQSICR